MPKILENVKESILLEGKKQLLEYGYKNLNIRSITCNCNIATGTFYNYFKNKDLLVTSIIESDWDKILNSMDDIYNEDIILKDKIFKIYSYMDNFVCTYLDTFVELGSSDKKCNKRDNVMKPVLTILEDIITKHKDLGDVTNTLSPDKLSIFILSNLVSLSRDRYLTFDELYSCLNI